MEIPKLLAKEDYKAVRTIRGLCSTEVAKAEISTDLEVRYIATFINSNRDTWAEVMMLHPETRDHFKEYEQSEVAEDGTSWLFSDNFWD